MIYDRKGGGRLKLTNDRREGNEDGRERDGEDEGGSEGMEKERATNGRLENARMRRER